MSRRCTLLACAAALLAFSAFLILPDRNAGQTSDVQRAQPGYTQKTDDPSRSKVSRVPSGRRSRAIHSRRFRGNESVDTIHDAPSSGGIYRRFC